MYKHWFRSFLSASPGAQHFSCHSHHFWPDVTKEAIIEYWEDSAYMVDDKWNHIFGVVLPQTQKLISAHLGLKHFEQIVFATSTHELLYRILSSFPVDKPLRVLSSDSEFHSFTRQMARLAERPSCEWLIEPCLPFQGFKQRLLDRIEREHVDVLFLSHVFYNSSLVVEELDEFIKRIPEHVTVIIDGYHGFMAVPTDLSQVEGRIFYLAGGYKYAAAGEGCCFAVIPKDTPFRPEQTGWWAAFDALDENDGTVPYSNNGMRFAGGTMDFSAVYKLRAVLQLYAKYNLTVPVIHAYIKKLQKRFLEHLETLNQSWVGRHNRLVGETDHGHFFTYVMQDAAQAKRLYHHLKEHRIFVDIRNERVRFGFAIYHAVDDYNLKPLETFEG